MHRYIKQGEEFCKEMEGIVTERYIVAMVMFLCVLATVVPIFCVHFRELFFILKITKNSGEVCLCCI